MRFFLYLPLKTNESITCTRFYINTTVELMILNVYLFLKFMYVFRTKKRWYRYSIVLMFCKPWVISLLIVLPHFHSKLFRSVCLRENLSVFF